jgi:hypothetical protein
MTDRLYMTGPMADYEPRCGFAMGPQDPRPRCTKPATQHIALLAEDLVAVHCAAACDEHEPIARRAAGERFLQEHAYEALCAWPGTLWDFDENRCVLDDSGVEQASRECAGVSA